MTQAARLTATYLIATFWASRADAHASEQGFVLLLPTELYTGAGVVAVGLTLALLGMLPAASVRHLFRHASLKIPSHAALQSVTCCIALFVLLALVLAGWWGPRDPLSNPLPLMVWVIFWIGTVSIQGIAGFVWPMINPFSALLGVLRFGVAQRAKAHLPRWIGQWPALAGFLGFAVFLLADPAPSDPARLAVIVAAYGAFQAIMLAIFGVRWLAAGEVFTVLMRLYGRVGAIALRHRALHVGAPGWQVAANRRIHVSSAVLCILLLGSGSFDGLNETFWWLSILGINPLEFPGRSAVVWQNAIGLLVANSALIFAFWLCLQLGAWMSKTPLSGWRALSSFAPTLLPIALGYHIAHYLPSFLVDSQYALVALSDPFLSGSDWLGLGEFYVSTGFFNTKASVRVIFLSQAGAVVLGHVIAILTAHAVAMKALPDRRKVLIYQAPLAAFMLLYTWFGLWLLASPRF